MLKNTDNYLALRIHFQPLIPRTGKRHVYTLVPVLDLKAAFQRMVFCGAHVPLLLHLRNGTGNGFY